MNKRIESFKYAFRGIAMVLKSEKNMLIHVIISILVLICGILFQISTTEWMICLLCFGLVFSTEMMNTAIETLVDLVSPNHHKLAGKAKDIAAGAVLVAAIFAAITGLIIFIPKGLALLNLFM